MLWTLLVAIMLALPGPWEPSAAAESSTARALRLWTIAVAIDLETETVPPGWGWSRKDLALAVLVKTYHEGARWRRDVHEGSTTGDGGRARCLGQVHPGPWAPEWDESLGLGLEPTRLCVRMVVRVLAHYHQRCVKAREPSLDAMAMVFAGYGTGTTCNPKLAFAQDRARHWWRLRATAASR
jgi:hypothetical protein